MFGCQDHRILLFGTRRAPVGADPERASYCEPNLSTVPIPNPGAVNGEWRAVVYLPHGLKLLRVRRTVSSS